ncbi:MAG: toll/interleukin-1 receptor domain-containing protein [Smithella sp.]
MEKPTIFFSHSSKDKIFISELKKKVLEQTSGTIEIFQSSDGESIPFGKNWVHKIEENLNNAKIMFVFVSPNSIKSNWIYFESGFSYSKGIRVIPIGILGIDVGSILPPMSLLQGFNVHNHEGLNNIIAILNDEFKCQYKPAFSEIDFEFIQKQAGFLEYIDNSTFDNIDYFETEFRSDLSDNELVEDPFGAFNRYLRDNNIKSSNSGNGKILLYGMEASVDSNSSRKVLKLKIDLLRLNESIDIITKLLPIMYKKPLNKYWLRLYFNNDIELIATNYKLSARLNEFGIEMSGTSGSLYIYNELLFAIDDKIDAGRVQRERQKLRVIFNPEKPNGHEILKLVKFLFSIGVIYSVKNV